MLILRGRRRLKSSHRTCRFGDASIPARTESEHSSRQCAFFQIQKDFKNHLDYQPHKNFKLAWQSITTESFRRLVTLPPKIRKGLFHHLEVPDYYNSTSLKLSIKAVALAYRFRVFEGRPSVLLGEFTALLRRYGQRAGYSETPDRNPTLENS